MRSYRGRLNGITPLIVPHLCYVCGCILLLLTQSAKKLYSCNYVNGWAGNGPIIPQSNDVRNVKREALDTHEENALISSNKTIIKLVSCSTVYLGGGSGGGGRPPDVTDVTKYNRRSTTRASKQKPNWWWLMFGNRSSWSKNMIHYYSIPPSTATMP
jgi:hypothetical protein